MIVSGAFLKAELEEPYFARPPEGYRTPGKVWQVNKYLYGDKRAPKGWQDYFAVVLKEYNLERLVSEPGAFYSKTKKLLLVVHVDDMLVIAHTHVLEEFVQFLKTKLKLKRVEHVQLGKPFAFLGDEITIHPNKVTIKAKDEYVDNMLDIMGMKNCRTVDTPMVHKESPEEGDDIPLTEDEQKKYQVVCGILMYYKRHRFDLHYAGKSLAMHASTATQLDMRRLKRVLRYCLKTRDMELVMPVQTRWPSTVVGWADASWADDPKTRRSTSGGVLEVAGACVHAWSRTQAIVAQSSAEAELYAATACAAELLWLR